MKRPCVAAIVVVLLSTLLCELPENPRNIDNAGIARQTLTTLPANVPESSVYPCTLTVRFPEFVDSFAVFTSINSAAGVKVAGAALLGDTVAVFSLHFSETGSYAFSLLVYKGYLTDTVSSTVIVFGTTPILTAAITRIVTSVDSAVVVRFDVSDPDSNLLEYTINSGSLVVDKNEFKASERASAAIRKELSASYLMTLRDTLVRFSALAMDADSQVSAAALCTLVVHDTIRPQITLLAPHTDSVRTVTKLPDTIRAVVRDNWLIDSVVYGDRRVAFSNGDTVRIIVAKLDSGKTVDTLEAWDPAGNRTSVGIALRYSGPKVYPPKVIPFYQTVNEGGRFDTVFLDQKVTITDSSATYGKDSLHWSMTIDSLDPDMTVHLDAGTRILTVTGPAGELFRDRMSTVSLTVTDPAGLSTSLHGVSFIMVEKDDQPRITLAGHGKMFSAAFDTLKLDTCGYDPENIAQLVWSITRGKFFVPEFQKVTYCTGLKLEKVRSRLPICREVPTGKVVILPDSLALAAVSSTLDVLDTLLFSLKSIASGDTVEVFKKVPFSWGRYKIFVPIEIPQFYKP